GGREKTVPLVESAGRAASGAESNEAHKFSRAAGLGLQAIQQHVPKKRARASLRGPMEAGFQGNLHPKGRAAQGVSQRVRLIPREPPRRVDRATIGVRKPIPLPLSPTRAPKCEREP